MVRVEHVSKSFEKKSGEKKSIFGKEEQTKQAILSDVTINIEDNQFVCILGKSGCGKSTLLNLLAGYIRADNGAIWVNNEEVKGPSANRGVVFQEHALFPWYTVRENIELGPKKIRKRADYKEITEKYLDMIGLKSYENYYPNQLSGGMQQRVGIARAFANSPEILLMDEPFSALDPDTREMMQNELLNLWKVEKKMVVFITHSVNEAVKLADKVVVLGAGHVLKEVKIDLDRPRDKQSPQFIAYAQEFRKLIHGEDGSEEEMREEEEK